MDGDVAVGGIILIQLLFFFGFLIFGLLSLAFWIWMLVDCLQNENDEGNDKLVWVLVIIFANWIGALIYFFVRRPERTRNQKRMSIPPPIENS